MFPSQVGRTRRKLAHMLSERFGVVIDPAKIQQNIDVYSRETGLPRWFVNVYFPERNDTVYIHAWDTMSDVLKYGLAVVYDKGSMIEVCADEKA